MYIVSTVLSWFCYAILLVWLPLKPLVMLVRSNATSVYCTRICPWACAKNKSLPKLGISWNAENLQCRHFLYLQYTPGRSMSHCTNFWIWWSVSLIILGFWMLAKVSAQGLITDFYGVVCLCNIGLDNIVRSGSCALHAIIVILLMTSFTCCSCVGL